MVGMVAPADSAVSEGHQILDCLAGKARKILVCKKVAICYRLTEFRLVIGGTAGCDVLRTGNDIGYLGRPTHSRPPDGYDGYTSLWNGEVIICGEVLQRAMELEMIVWKKGLIGYLISGDREEPPSAEDVTMGLKTAQQIASVVIEHFRPELRRR